MPVIILVAVLAVGWMFTGVLYVLRTRDARDTIQILSDAHAEAQDLRIDAERRAEAAETECGFLRATVAGMIQRPAVAVMTNEHIQQFASIVQSIVHPEAKQN